MNRGLFGGRFKDKRVLVTGHTGFKGSWLALWLTALGADVAGYSAYLPSTPCNFSVLQLKDRVRDFQGDVRDQARLKEVFEAVEPEIVFHLAAQPIVRRSFAMPKLTFDTNVGGTVNVLESIRQCPQVQAAVIITSDKCYQNLEWTWGYRENDRLGGDDPYSASKACAEMVVHAYSRSFFQHRPGSPAASIATTRAGNVIGGGDWAEDRIMPDCMRAWSAGRSLIVRHPKATRPWQHVLEPLSGYLCLGADLLKSNRCHGEAFNFGPDPHINPSVGELIAQARRCWETGRWEMEANNARGKNESTLLKLCCDKAQQVLGWRATLTLKETVAMTVEWYRRFYDQVGDMSSFSTDQIERYITLAGDRGIAWAAGETV